MQGNGCGVTHGDLGMAGVSTHRDRVDVRRRLVVAVNSFGVRRGLVTDTRRTLSLSVVTCGRAHRQFVVNGTSVGDLALSLDHRRSTRRGCVSTLRGC